jgi:hypothetical protein
MRDLSGKAVVIRLRNCQAWTVWVGVVGDIVEVHGGHWATGIWREPDERYVQHSPSGPGLKEVEEGEIIGLCEHGNWCFPPSIQCKLDAAARSPVIRLTKTGRKILRALRARCATNSDTAISIQALLHVADFGNHDSKNVRDTLKSLAAAGFIERRQKMGTWLTPEGVEALNQRE